MSNTNVHSRTRSISRLPRKAPVPDADLWKVPRAHDVNRIDGLSTGQVQVLSLETREPQK